MNKRDEDRLNSYTVNCVILCAYPSRAFHPKFKIAPQRHHAESEHALCGYSGPLHLREMNISGDVKVPSRNSPEL
jgi:hypothetical protein